MIHGTLMFNREFWKILCCYDWPCFSYVCNWIKGSIIGRKLFRSSKIGRPTDLPMSDVPVFSPFFLGTIQSSLRNVSGWDLMTQCAKFFPKWRPFFALQTSFFDYIAYQNIFQFIFRYYTIEPEERIRLEMNDPMCEVFPKMAACRYQRYGMGGREDNRHAICILGLNMVNDKVFIVLWIWHCFICTVGIIRILTRTRYCRVEERWLMPH